MAKVKRKRRLSKRILRIVFICALAMGYTYSALFVYKGFFHGEIPKKTVLNYSTDSKLDYAVKLLDNEFLEEDTQTEEKSHISELVETVNPRFHFEYVMSKSGQIKYTYSIKGTLIGEYATTSQDTEKKIVWEETEPYDFVPEKSVTINNASTLRISEEFPIDFQKINNKVIDFKNSLKIPINAYLNVDFNLKYYTIVEGKEVNKTSKMRLQIPFNQIAFDISKDVPTGERGIVTYDIMYQKYEIRNFILGGILFFITTLVLILERKIIFNIKKYSRYEQEINKIKKQYSDIIIEITSAIDESNSNVVLVSTFAELLDLEEELRFPINFYEYEKGIEAWFIIVHNNIIYKYIYINSDYDNPKK